MKIDREKVRAARAKEKAVAELREIKGALGIRILGDPIVYGALGSDDHTDLGSFDRVLRRIIEGLQRDAFELFAEARTE